MASVRQAMARRNGAYRFVRNPMYLAVLAIVLGQALLFGSWGLVLYAVITLAAVVAFVKGYEEPTLTRTYGEQYLDYRRNVPGFVPATSPARAGARRNPGWLAGLWGR